MVHARYLPCHPPPFRFAICWKKGGGGVCLVFVGEFSLAGSYTYCLVGLTGTRYLVVCVCFFVVLVTAGCTA